MKSIADLKATAQAAAEANDAAYWNQKRDDFGMMGWLDLAEMYAEDIRRADIRAYLDEAGPDHRYARWEELLSYVSHGRFVSLEWPTEAQAYPGGSYAGRKLRGLMLIALDMGHTEVVEEMLEQRFGFVPDWCDWNRNLEEVTQ